MKYTIIFLLPLFLSSLSLSAPIPVTSSSLLLNRQKGTFLSAHGFKIHSSNTRWGHQGAPIENPNILTMYKAPVNVEGVNPALTVRVDQLKKRKNITRYINSWKKDFSRFGFSILNSKKIKINNNTAFLLDLVNSNSNKQLRQVVFLKQKTAVILTCRGAKSQFSKTVKTCNQLFRNFSWL